MVLVADSLMRELNLLRCVPGCDVDFCCRVGYRGDCRDFGYRDGDCDVDCHDDSGPSFLVDCLGCDNCHDHHAVPRRIKEKLTKTIRYRCFVFKSCI